MSLTIASFRTRVASKIHGKDVDKISDFYGLCKEAAGNVVLQIDPAETRRIESIENAIYDAVYDYAAPADLKGDRVIDIRPQSELRDLPTNITNRYTKEFDLYKGRSGNAFTIQQDSMVKTLRIDANVITGVVLNSMEDIATNGTWAATAGIANLEQDTVRYMTGNASLRFDTTSSTTGYIENSTMTALDLTDDEDFSSMFLWLYVPSGAVLTNVNLRWGSSSSNYWNKTVTTAHPGNAFVAGSWNLLRFDWSTATEVGTGVASAVNYARVTLTYSGTANDWRVDSLMSKVPSIYDIEYYSKYLFRSSAGTWLEIPTAETDLINLDTESENVFLYEFCELVAQEISGEDSAFDVKYWSGKKREAWDSYKALYKSQAIKKTATYYRSRAATRR